ncbi:uncharacterized protein BDV14DRAFT_204020 [Aspergillus stella-maris]|uniref:uncharacterized protein n=1 Tax=Aspergillus stella-maris TaxID=1810926 RepID=UPI003CCE2DFC
MAKKTTPKPNAPLSVLSAKVDLAARKTPEDHAREATLINRAPAKAQEILQKGCQKQSTQLIEHIALYLSKQGITHYSLFCGYRVDEGSWQVCAIFGKLPEMDDALRIETRLHILEKFLRTRPDIDMVVNEVKNVPLRLIARWDGQSSHWKHMTKFSAWEGKPYVIKVDGQIDTDEIRAFSWASNQPGSSSLSWLSRFILKRTVGKEDPSRKELSLEQAFEKMRTQGKEGRDWEAWAASY